MTTPGDGPDLRALRDVRPPSSLVAAVMTKVERRRSRGFRDWLFRRRFVFSLSPATMAAGALTLVLGAFVARERLGSEAQDLAPPATVADDVVAVRFVLVQPGARRVSLAGDFNAWNPEGTPLAPSADGQTFIATVPVPRGTHEYLFNVDGRWVTDPASGEQRPDGFGGTNSVLRL